MFKVSELLKATGGRLVSGRLDLRVQGISTDTRTIKRGELFIAIKGNRFDGHDFISQAIKKGAKAILVTKKFKVKKEIAAILVKDTLRALGDIAHFHRRRFSIPVIGITGSNGKTTTKDMVCFLLESKYHVLRNQGSQNNQIGLPLTLLKLNKNHNLVVLEMGTNHFGEIKRLSRIAGANIGVMLNIGPSHLEFLRNLKSVFQEKYNLIKNLKSPAIGILNKDDPFLSFILRNIKNKFLISFGLKKGCDFQARDLKLYNNRLVFKLDKYLFRLNTLGIFNVYNALASITIERIFGIDYPDIVSRISRFRFPQGRLNLRKINKTIFIDDTYNSNPASLGEALGVLKNIRPKARKIAVLGDMLELGPKAKEFHIEAGRQLSGICDIIITAGDLSRLAALTAKKEGLKDSAIFMCSSSKEAKEALFNMVKPKDGDVILVKGSRMMKMEEIF